MSDERLCGLDREELLGMLRRMIEIRLFEDEVMSLFTPQPRARVARTSARARRRSPSAPARRCEAGDTMTCTYRGHGAVLAMGAPLDGTFAEILGKAARALRAASGGSMHLTDVIGRRAGLVRDRRRPPAVRLRHRRSPRSTSSTGSVSRCASSATATTNIGAFHEALNLASIWKLPVVFVCENNLYGEYSPLASTTPVERARRAGGAATRCRACAIDGNDVLAVREAVGEAVERAARRRGADLIEALTYRHKGHSRTDPATYRPQGELEAWLERDPITALRGVAASSHGDRGRGASTRRERGAETPSRSALERALAWPEPDPASGSRRLRMSERHLPRGRHPRARRRARADERVVLIGEDVGAAGGVFKATEGLFDAVRRATRVRDTPISEQAIVGAALGAAVAGLRPVGEIMFADFAGVCYDQIANQLAKYRYRAAAR